MQSQRGKFLGPLSIVVAVFGLVVVVVTGAATFFGGTKLRPLFGMSPEALERNAAEGRNLGRRAPDAGLAQVPDAGDTASVATP
ncbi:hypothetical protein [Corallococcus macrosporus]|uniref:Uncharacterized protein n=1 Tax=Myxococcus fulvus (strain ATCC BAA-855 / HW-1) TaxID=483219 RepID=F8CHF1_MYXFH|nr:hypothetical protein [Corallococcus macrosporus]AEI66269.1 hypothetical protein LILAB_21845 [Corallococcus macrosporus]